MADRPITRPWLKANLGAWLHELAAELETAEILIHAGIDGERALASITCVQNELSAAVRACEPSLKGDAGLRDALQPIPRGVLACEEELIMVAMALTFAEPNSDNSKTREHLTQCIHELIIASVGVTIEGLGERRA